MKSVNVLFAPLLRIAAYSSALGLAALVYAGGLFDKSRNLFSDDFAFSGPRQDFFFAGQGVIVETHVF